MAGVGTNSPARPREGNASLPRGGKVYNQDGRRNFDVVVGLDTNVDLLELLPPWLGVGGVLVGVVGWPRRCAITHTNPWMAPGVATWMKSAK